MGIFSKVEKSIHDFFVGGYQDIIGELKQTYEKGAPELLAQAINVAGVAVLMEAEQPDKSGADKFKGALSFVSKWFLVQGKTIGKDILTKLIQDSYLRLVHAPAILGSTSPALPSVPMLSAVPDLPPAGEPEPTATHTSESQEAPAQEEQATANAGSRRRR